MGQIATIQNFTSGKQYTFKGTSDDYLDNQCVVWDLFEVYTMPITAYVLSITVRLTGNLFIATVYPHEYMTLGSSKIAEDNGWGYIPLDQIESYYNIINGNYVDFFGVRGSEDIWLTYGGNVNQRQNLLQFNGLKDILNNYASCIVAFNGMAINAFNVGQIQSLGHKGVGGDSDYNNILVYEDTITMNANGYYSFNLELLINDGNHMMSEAGIYTGDQYNLMWENSSYNIFRINMTFNKSTSNMDLSYDGDGVTQINGTPTIVDDGAGKRNITLDLSIMNPVFILEG